MTGELAPVHGTEQVIAERKNGPLAHLPSGVFTSDMVRRRSGKAAPGSPT